MAKLAQQLLRILVSAWLGAHAAACAKGDIVLGEVGSVLAPAGTGASAGAGGSSGAGGAENAIGQAGAAVSGGDAAGSGGAIAEAGAPAAAGSSGSGPDAGSPPPTVARPSAGCGRDPALANMSITVSGLDATYLTNLPAAYDKARAYPLVLAFRGTDLSADEFRAELNLGAVAGATAIIVHANPLDDAVTWDFQRDMQLVGGLLAKLGADYCIDLDRVFAIGDGMGSLFVNLVGCQRGDQVRAIAALSSVPPPPGQCVGNPAVLLMQQRNTDPMTFGAGLGNRDFWAARNACDVPMQVAPTQCVDISGCRASSPVRYCEYDGTALPKFAASGAWSFFEAL
jgi:polyhydroxybutyrate depolymerase